MQVKFVAFNVVHEGGPVPGVGVEPEQSSSRGTESFDLAVKLVRVNRYVEMHSVLGRIRLGDALEVQPGPGGLRVAGRDGVSEEQPAVTADDVRLSDDAVSQ